MPNWCENRLEISADNIAEIVEALAGEDSALDFERLLPMPDVLRRSSVGSRTFEIDGEAVTLTTWYHEETGDPTRPIMRPFTPEEQAQLDLLDQKDWHSWRVTNWGTKWNATNVKIDVDDYTARWTFDTAWGPPEGVVDAIRARWPEAYVTAFYDEPGMQISGYY